MMKVLDYLRIYFEHVDFLGFLAATLSAIALLPQIHQIWVTRSAKDISFGMLALLLSGSIVQMIYAVLTHQIPVIVTNCISITLRTLVLGCKLYMDWRASQKSS
ncbi:MAG: PQ-loop repeat-containing protein [Alphaproteobacteria bacterium]|nr:PQ-loop repeat-containing protein [Alphaproteobacteria bacterium]